MGRDDAAVCIAVRLGSRSAQPAHAACGTSGGIGGSWFTKHLREALWFGKIGCNNETVADPGWLHIAPSAPLWESG